MLTGTAPSTTSSEATPLDNSTSDITDSNDNGTQSPTLPDTEYESGDSITSPDTTSSTQATIPPILNFLFPELSTATKKSCEKLTHKVYGSNDSQVDQIALESVTTNYVHVYIWSASSMQYKSYTSEQFAKEFLDVAFKYIGRTTKGQCS